jgi:hypothetical protein
VSAEAAIRLHDQSTSLRGERGDAAFDVDGIAQPMAWPAPKIASQHRTHAVQQTARGRLALARRERRLRKLRLLSQIEQRAHGAYSRRVRSPPIMRNTNNFDGPAIHMYTNAQCGDCRCAACATWES